MSHWNVSIFQQSHAFPWYKFELWKWTTANLHFFTWAWFIVFSICVRMNGTEWDEKCSALAMKPFCVASMLLPATSWPWSTSCHGWGPCHGSWWGSSCPVRLLWLAWTCERQPHRSEDQPDWPRKHVPSDHQRQFLDYSDSVKFAVVCSVLMNMDFMGMPSDITTVIIFHLGLKLLSSCIPTAIICIKQLGCMAFIVQQDLPFPRRFNYSNMCLNRHHGQKHLLVPWVLVTKVLPRLRMLNMAGALTSYQSFLENGSTLKDKTRM